MQLRYSAYVTVPGGAGTITATVVPETNQPAVPTGTVQVEGGPPVALAGGRATLRVPNATAPVKVIYSGDALYNATNGTIAYAATSADTPVGATVPATLSLTLGPAASFGALVPGDPNDYTASTTANVISTAGDAALSVSDPGRLANGAFTLPQPLRVEIAPNAWSGPVSKRDVHDHVPPSGRRQRRAPDRDLQPHADVHALDDDPVGNTSIPIRDLQAAVDRWRVA